MNVEYPTKLKQLRGSARFDPGGGNGNTITIASIQMTEIIRRSCPSQGQENHKQETILPYKQQIQCLIDCTYHVATTN